MRALSYIGAEKITFPPKSDGRTDANTYRRTDISNYRIVSLLKNMYLCFATCGLCNLFVIKKVIILFYISKVVIRWGDGEGES